MADGFDVKAAAVGFRVGSLKILDQVNLAVQAGEFVGVLGPSGCGKSTLLRALSGQLPLSDGKVLVDGQDVADAGAGLHSRIGFVPQDDIVHQGLRVERALLFSARLRMPEVSGEDHDRAVDEVLGQLDLLERRKLRIDRLSGGQRKRVSIGVELLTRPRLLFLDEPTSGLDPGLEEQFMELCHRQSRTGRTVILTTHVLQSLDLLDLLVVMVKGRLVFFGSPSDALQHFGIKALADVYRVLSKADPEPLASRFVASVYFEKNIVQRLQA